MAVFKNSQSSALNHTHVCGIGYASMRMRVELEPKIAHILRTELNLCELAALGTCGARAIRLAGCGSYSGGDVRSSAQ